MSTKQVTLIALATSLATVAVVAALLWVAGVAGAGPLASNGGSVPHLINYQGRLTDASGDPLTGDYDMRFCLYADAECPDGSDLWREFQTVSVTYGVFSVLLPIPETLFDGPELYLGVKVGDDAEMRPCRRVVSAGYAYKAEDAAQAEHATHADQAINADMVDGLHASEIIRPTMTVYVGHADIGSHADVAVIEKVYFHLNTAPTSVKLYLWGEKFSPFFYTELGRHSHVMSHDHAVFTSNPWASGVCGCDGVGWSNAPVTDRGPERTQEEGVPGGPLSTVVKDWLNDMRVWIDGVDRTADVLALTPLTEFGDGTEGHAFNTEIGSGEMDITSLITGTGQHVIEFKVASGGGRIRYELYVSQ